MGSSIIIATGNGGDNITVRGSQMLSMGLPGTGFPINARGGNDKVFVEDSILQATVSGSSIPISISLGSGDDSLTLGNRVELRGINSNGTGNGEILCAQGFDTIVFAMDVPEEALPFISSQITTAELPNGSITINGLFYQWEECELLVNELNGVRVVRPIPTLSEWGLIVVAGVLGIVSFITVYRRKASA